jgi:hypothetical protein
MEFKVEMRFATEVFAEDSDYTFLPPDLDS